MLRLLRTLDMLDTPDAVLTGLQRALRHTPMLNVLGAALFPTRWGNWEALVKGKTVFLHTSAPAGWWEEYKELLRHSPGPALVFAPMSLAPFTHLEITRVLELIGADRWSTDLALKYGIRDGFHCPIGKRWILTYWSPQVLDLSDEVRAILFMGATFACIRLQKLEARHPPRMGDGAALTAPELSVLRALSLGLRLGDIAEQLELKEETIRSHLKRAEGKLGVHDRCHAVAQAIRESLIL